MSKRSLVSFILLLAIPATVGAEMYRCELSDGSVIYGDKRVNLSDDCQPVTGDSPKEYLSIQQPTPRKPAPNKPVGIKPAPASETTTDASVDSWTTRATKLVENYNDARKRRTRESYMVNKQKAMRDMKSIQTEKKEMLAELHNSSLSKQKREEIKEILAEIPEVGPKP